MARCWPCEADRATEAKGPARRGGHRDDRSRGYTWIACLLALGLTVVTRAALRRAIPTSPYGVCLWYGLWTVVLACAGLLLRRWFPEYRLHHNPGMGRLLPEFCVNSVAGAAVLIIVWNVAGPEPSKAEAALRALPSWFAAWAVIKCALGPFGEELFWRLGIYGTLRTTMGRVPAVVVHSLAFAAWHGSLAGSGWRFIVAALLALSFERSRHLISPIAFHVSFNTAGLALSVWWFV